MDAIGLVGTDLPVNRARLEDSERMQGTLPQACLEFPLMERPGTIAHRIAEPRSLSEADLIQLGRCLFPVYMSGFMHENEDVLSRQQSFFEDLLKHIGATERLTLLEQPQGEVHGFVCASVTSAPVGSIYHLEGIILDEKFQGRGLGFEILSHEIAESGADILAFHTQSIRMFRLGQRLADLNPSVAESVAPLIPHSNLVGAVDRERYGSQPLYGDMERLKKIALSEIDVEKGDAVFAAGYIKGRVL